MIEENLARMRNYRLRNDQDFGNLHIFGFIRETVNANKIFVRTKVMGNFMLIRFC